VNCANYANLCEWKFIQMVKIVCVWFFCVFMCQVLIPDWLCNCPMCSGIYAHLFFWFQNDVYVIRNYQLSCNPDYCNRRKSDFSLMDSACECTGHLRTVCQLLSEVIVYCSGFSFWLFIFRLLPACHSDKTTRFDVNLPDDICLSLWVRSENRAAAWFRLIHYG